jgi:carboxypeptidase PM20D1
MRTWRRAAVRGLAALTVILATVVGLVVVRTLRLISDQVAVAAVAEIAVDDGAVGRLSEAIRLRTVSHPDPDQVDGEAFLALHRLLEEGFPRVHRALEREVLGEYSLLYTWRGTDAHRPPILLLAHLDVVPVESKTEQAWAHPPFSGDVASGFIWGRGTLDDKGSALAILEAVESLLASGFRPDRTVLLALGHDEEVGGRRGAATIASRLRTRGDRPAFILDEGSAITRGVVPGVTPPAALVGVAEKGYLSVELTAETAGGHSSMPPPQTAIGVLCTAIHALETNPMPASLDGPVYQMFLSLAPEMPFAQRMAFANLWLFGGMVERKLSSLTGPNAVLRTTAAATMFAGGVADNVLPGRARAVVNFRIKPGDRVADVLDHVRRTVADDRVGIRPLEGTNIEEPSPVSSTESEGYDLIRTTIRQVIPDAVVAPSLVVAATDTRHYQGLKSPTYRFLPVTLGPDDLRRIHGTDERIRVDDYLRSIRFYALLIRNAASGPGGGADVQTGE